MKVTFYYVRHGRTLFNEIERMQGMCDSPLTEEGIEGAYDTASALCRVPFGHAFSSSSERAWETARIICKQHNLEPIPMKGLREFDFGDLDGTDIKKFRNRTMGHNMEDDWTAYHGESDAIFKERTDKAFAEILEQCHDEEKVLVVSHGAFLMHLMKTMLNYDQKAYVERCNQTGRKWMPNSGICIFTWEDGAWHLEEEPMTAQEYRLKHDHKTVHFVYVRHGETQFNIQGRLQGQCDSPLTDAGIAQAEGSAYLLRNMMFDRAYCSTAERARDTADILLKGRGMHAIPDVRLREVYYGIYEGMRFKTIMNEMIQRNLNVHYSDLKGEDRKDVQKRLGTFFRDVIDRAHDGDTILLVSHCDLYFCILEMLFGMKRVDIYREAKKANTNPAPNGGIARFTYDGTFHIDELMWE